MDTINYKHRIAFSSVRIGQTFCVGSDVYVKVDSPFDDAQLIAPDNSKYIKVEPGAMVYVIGGGLWDNQSLHINK